MGLIINARFLTQKITGVQRYALEISRQIIAQRKNVTFVAPDAVLHPHLAAELKVQTIGRLKGHLWEQTELPLYLRNIGNPPLLNLANTAPLFYRRNYVTLHDLAFLHHAGWNTAAFNNGYRFLIPKIARRAQHVFTVSYTMKEELYRLLSVPEGKITVTYNGIASSFPPPDASFPKKKMLLAVGTFNRRKNHDKLIAAFLKSNLAQEYTLVIAGDKEKIYKELSLPEEGNNIQIISAPDDRQLVRLYCEAEAVISLSAYEGFGLPVLEGLYYGGKALCSDIPVYRELFGNYAYFCDISDLDSIIFSLNELASSSYNKEKNTQLLFGKYSYACAASELLRILP